MFPHFIYFFLLFTSQSLLHFTHHRSVWIAQCIAWLAAGPHTFVHTLAKSVLRLSRPVVPIFFFSFTRWASSSSSFPSFLLVVFFRRTRCLWSTPQDGLILLLFHWLTSKMYPVVGKCGSANRSAGKTRSRRASQKTTIFIRLISLVFLVRRFKIDFSVTFDSKLTAL